MKKYIFLSAALLLLIASCSNDDNNNETKEQVQTVQFSFTNEEFGEDETLTRSAETAKPQIVDLGDCEAEITVESEPAAKTRGALSPANGHYTIRAYQAGTLKDEMKGTFSSGTFTPDASSNKKLRLPYGTYDFVAFNDDVTVSGPNLTTTRDKAGTARMGFATVNITGPTPIQVQFTMKHVGARLRTQFVCKKDIPNAITTTLEATAANVIPTRMVYNILTQVKTYTKGSIAAVPNNSLASTEAKYSASNYGANYSYTSTGGYHYFLPTTEGSKLKLANLSAGTVFWKPLTGTIPQLNATLSIQAGKSYLVKIKLKPNYTYLMSDGTTGHFKDTTFGGAPAATAKTPIAVVLDKGSHMAIALNYAGGGAKMWWCGYPYLTAQTNTHTVTNLNDALNSQTTSGFDETWDPSYSTGSIGVKATNPAFFAPKLAAEYNSGVTYTGVPVLRWYLPSYNDFKWIYSLGFGDRAVVHQIFQNYNWYGNLTTDAFTQVGGTGIANKWHWSSSEYELNGGYSDVGLVLPGSMYMQWSYAAKNNDYYVRPFVKY
ncbi:MAG: hypothetical protein ACTTJL_01465 [Hoylesella enoeca]|uniref:hypothetical protein n=1 Tax=Hoylesella enoeca TaxID=76123 RepID=UPI003FA097C8